MTLPSFILASASPRRIDLLEKIGMSPDAVIPADVDETPFKTELPEIYALRMACEKAQRVAARNPGQLVLSADTVVACGRRILPKAEDEQQARQCLMLLSGRRHRVYTAVAVVDAAGILRSKVVMSAVKCNRLTAADIEAYVATGEWHGKAGGYAIQGAAAAFMPWINGSVTGIIGLPLAETALLLKQSGYKAKPAV